MAKVISTQILMDNTNYITYVVKTYSNGLSNVYIYNKRSGCYIPYGVYKNRKC